MAKGLEQLCRYIARPPLAKERVEAIAEGHWVILCVLGGAELWYPDLEKMPEQRGAEAAANAPILR